MKIIQVINYSPKLQNYIAQFKISGSSLVFLQYIKITYGVVSSYNILQS